MIRGTGVKTKELRRRCDKVLTIKIVHLGQYRMGNELKEVTE